MKFLCPNCKAKYRIGPEKMVGRQAAKIRCRKCEYLIQIAYRGEGEEPDVTATPPTVPPAGSGGPRAASGSGSVPSGSTSAAAARSRLAPPDKQEGSASKKPTAAVPGLPGLGSAKSTRGAALMSDPARRPLAPLPPPPLSAASTATGAFAAVGLPPGANVGASLPLPAPPPSRAGSGSTPLADQFRESVQAGGVEELPQEGWFVGVNGVPLGPIPLGDLRELALAGHIDRRSLVWREGQAEWRPLGKFPGLARVIDENAAPPSPARPEPQPPARSNGLNGHGSHVATGFDVVRPDTAERPSVWGDIEEEDDEDEQPTTVKGRVSVLPASGAFSFEAPPSSPAPSPAPAPAPAAARPFTQSVLAFPAAPAASSPGFGADSGLRSFSPRPEQHDLSSRPEAVGDGESQLSQTRSRKRLYIVIAAAVVVAFGLGVLIASQLMRGSESGKPELEGVRSRSRAVVGSAARAAAPAEDPPAGPPQGAVAAIFGATAPAPRQSELAAPVAASLLGRKAPRGKRAAASLDPATVQRNVRRQSAAVRRNCWPRASKARAAGAPASAKVTASITVHAAGYVEKVTVTQAPRGYPGLARCVESTVKDWRFPRAAGPTRTKVPFMFVGRG